MSKVLNLEVLKKSIKVIVEGGGGIKMNDLVIPLCHNLINEGYIIKGDEVQNLIYMMIDDNSIYEVSYILDGRHRSFLLPANVHVLPSKDLSKSSDILEKIEDETMDKPIDPSVVDLPPSSIVKRAIT